MARVAVEFREHRHDAVIEARGFVRKAPNKHFRRYLAAIAAPSCDDGLSSRQRRYASLRVDRHDALGSGFVDDLPRDVSPLSPGLLRRNQQLQPTIPICDFPMRVLEPESVVRLLSSRQSSTSRYGCAAEGQHAERHPEEDHGMSVPGRNAAKASRAVPLRCHLPEDRSQPLERHPQPHQINSAIGLPLDKMRTSRPVWSVNVRLMSIPRNR